MRQISPIDLKGKLDRGEEVQIIDTREPEKYAECHLEGAINIPQIDLPDSLHLVRSDIMVVIYCQYGVKSDAPYLFLREKHKLKNVIVLEGGIYQWANDIDQTMSVF